MAPKKKPSPSKRKPTPDPMKPVPQPVVLAQVPWDTIRDLYVAGEELPDLDSSSEQHLRRWPALTSLATRFNVGMAELSARATVDGWEARKGMFQAEVERARQRAITERIARQDVSSRLAYMGIHNDLIRGVGRLLQQNIPAQVPAGGSGCSFLPRDLKVIADTTLTCAEIMGAAQGRVKGTESPMTLAVQIANAQMLGVPVPGLAPSQQPSLIQAIPGDSGKSQQVSLWSVLVEARRAPADPGPALDPYDHPSPLPTSLASDRR